MTAEVVVVGTELLLGGSLDTNSQWLCRRLAALGVNVYRRTTVGDNLSRVTDSLREALSRADVVLVSGGLGPTVDDVTRQAVAQATDRPLELRDDLLSTLKDRFAQRGVAMTDNNALQAMLPRGAAALPNPEGSATGIWLELAGKVVCALPGVPRELTAMFDAGVAPALSLRAGPAERLHSRVLRLAGIPESHVDKAIEDLFRSLSNPTIGVLAHTGIVEIRITARAQDPEDAARRIAEVERQLLSRVGDHVFGFDDESLEAVCGKNLAARGWRLALAESLTGGLIGHRVTSVAGSSAWFDRSVVAYSNRAKIELLGVSEEILARHGAVSEECAAAMARGVVRSGTAEVALAVTGVAGPGGATREKPVGLVYVALSHPGGVACERHRFLGGREHVKEWTASAALTALWRFLTGAADLSRRAL